MNWIIYIVFILVAIFSYCAGYAHGYWSDKKEVNEFLTEAQDLYHRAETLHTQSGNNLAKARMHLEEAQNLVNEMKKELKNAK